MKSKDFRKKKRSIIFSTSCLSLTDGVREHSQELSNLWNESIISLSKQSYRRDRKQNICSLLLMGNLSWIRRELLIILKKRITTSFCQLKAFYKMSSRNQGILLWIENLIRMFLNWLEIKILQSLSKKHNSLQTRSWLTAISLEKLKLKRTLTISTL